MTAAGGVFGQDHVAGVDGERVTAAHLEGERSARGDHVLPMRRGVPGEAGSGRALGDGHGGHPAEHLAARVVVELGELDLAFGEVRLAVVARRQVHQADGHRDLCLVQPALLQTIDRPVVLSDAQRVVQRVAQLVVVERARDRQTLVGRDLLHDREIGPVLHQPRRHREELDERADRPGGEVVERVEDAGVRVVLDRGDRALGLERLRHRVRRVPHLDADDLSREIVDRRDRRRARGVHHEALARLQVRIGEPGDGLRSGVTVVPEITAS